MIRTGSSRPIIVLGIALVAFSLRISFLAARPIWYDEAFSIFLSEQDWTSIIRGAAVDVQPPLYYFLLHVWLSLGENVFVLRFLSVALSLVAASLVYVIIVRLSTPNAAAFAYFFAAIAPFQIYYAQELRMYSLLAFGSMLYLYGICHCNDHPRWKGLVLVVLGAVVALYAHSLAVLTLVAGNVNFLFKRNWRAQICLLAAQLIAAVLFIPWLLYMPGQVESIQRAYWTQPPGFADLLQSLVLLTAYLPLPMLAFVGALFASIAIPVFAAFALWRTWRRKGSAELGLLLTFALVPLVLMFALSYVMRPIFIPRGLVASALAYYMLLAMLAANAARVGRVIVAGVAVIIAIGALPSLYTSYGEWRRAPFAQADQFLRAEVRPDDLILHDNKLVFFPMHFYDRTLPQEFLADPLGAGSDTLAIGSQQAMGLVPVEFDAAIRVRPRVWFVIFQTALDEAAEQGQPHGNLARLDAAMVRRGVTAFGDLRIYRYEAR